MRHVARMVGDSRSGRARRNPQELVLVLLWALALLSACYAMLSAVSVQVSDPDAFWVAAAGRELLAQHRVPTTNLFSFTEPNTPWVMHEWLLGPVYAIGLQQLGPAFFIATALVLLSAA